MPRGLLTLLALTLVGATPGLATAQRDGDRIDSTFTLERGGLVQLGAVSGEIRVTGANRRDVRVVASLERGLFEISASPSRLAIRTRSVNDRQSTARYEVTVPVGTRVSATTVSGRIEISATEGEVTARATSGSVDVRDARERVDIGTVSGDVDLTRSSGRMRVEGVSGSISASDVAGDLSAETVSGEVDIRRARLTELTAKALSGPVRYDGTIARDGSYRLNTHSGSITLTLPPDVGASLELESFSGRISSDFPLTLQPGETGGRRGRRMDFTLGSGGARITAGAFSGNIYIRRGAAGTRE